MVTPTPALPRGLVFPPYEHSVLLTRRESVWRLWLRAGGHFQCFDGDAEAFHSWALGESADLAAHIARQLSRSSPRQFAGLALDRPRLMGILNVTPNSFSDGGRYLATDAAIRHGLYLAEQGADIIDVGGESTRPGAAPVAIDEEIARIVPVVRGLVAEGLLVSIDSRNGAVMEAALAEGARIINDVSGLTHDPGAMAVAARSDAAIILMHSQGDPQVMQRDPRYDDAPLEIYDWLRARLEACSEAGIAQDRLCVDPGVGFGKSLAHNCQIIATLDLYHALSVPLLLGVSRKSFIATLSRGEPADQRLSGSIAAALFGLEQGAQILRVHDIAETAQAVAVWRAIKTKK